MQSWGLKFILTEAALEIRSKQIAPEREREIRGGFFAEIIERSSPPEQTLWREAF
jgi:hypothetical protein